MDYSKPKVTIDLGEYIAMQDDITRLSAPGEGEQLTEQELQESVGELLKRSLQNPRLFSTGGIIDIGKYTANIVFVAGLTSTRTDEARVMVKISRK